MLGQQSGDIWWPNPTRSVAPGYTYMFIVAASSAMNMTNVANVLSKSGWSNVVVSAAPPEYVQAMQTALGQLTTPLTSSQQPQIFQVVATYTGPVGTLPAQIVGSPVMLGQIFVSGPVIGPPIGDDNLPSAHAGLSQSATNVLGFIVGAAAIGGLVLYLHNSKQHHFINPRAIQSCNNADCEICKKAGHEFKVTISGDVGEMYKGRSLRVARQWFKNYVSRSQNRNSYIYGKSVVLFRDNVSIDSYRGGSVTKLYES